MKIITTLLGLLFSAITLKSQSFVLPIYLADALGNKDTVYVSGDLTASTGLDANFGEINLNGTPYDSTFEARLTNDVFSATRIETKKQALYYECPSVWAGNLQQNPLLVRCKNWPLTIKWDRHLIDSVPLCIQVSGISNMLEYFGNGTPQYRLNTIDSISYIQSQLYTPYNTGTNNGQSVPVYVVAIGISGDGTTGVENVESSFFSVYPNPASNTITLNLEGEQAETLSIYNTNGQLIKTIDMPLNTTIDVSSFATGAYITEVKVRGVTRRSRWIKM